MKKKWRLSKKKWKAEFGGYIVSINNLGLWGKIIQFSVPEFQKTVNVIQRERVNFTAVYPVSER